MTGIVYSRAYDCPVRGWVPEIGPVNVVGERELFGHVFQKEVVVIATGVRRSIDVHLVFEGDNISHFVTKDRTVSQLTLGLGDAPCA